MSPPGSASVDFFDRQFRRQIDADDYALNPFEAAALPFLEGDVLDLGCGLGNLAIAAARRGARVTALDACATAVENLARRAREAGLDIATAAVDLRDWRPDRQWDAVACIGLLMFFPAEAARAGLAAVRDAVRPGGVAAVNVLVEGTTYLDMFNASGHCLFAEGEIARAFAGWTPLHASADTFPAPGGTVKRFETLIARRPKR
ncbi:MAG: SAM-dependent methyltransferase [Usitatibacter sp.]